MKNLKIIIFNLFVLFFHFSFTAQTTQSDFIGTWTMSPIVDGNNLSKMVIKDNGSSLLISLKKEPFKSFNAKYDASQRKLRSNINGTNYFFVFIPSNGTIHAYLESTNTKFADYLKN